MVDPIRIGYQGSDGRFRQQDIDPNKPLEINGVNVSVDDRGRVTVRGTEKDEQYSVYDGSELRRPGETVVGIEGNGDPLYLSIPNQHDLRVDGGAGNDEYWAPLPDRFSRVSIDDTQGNNWVTNIGRNVKGRVSVADDQLESLGNAKGGLELVPSGENSGNPFIRSIGSFLQSAWSYLGERFR